MQTQDVTNETKGLNGETRSMQSNGKTMPETALSTQRNRTTVAVPVTPILVSEAQFLTVREEQLASLALLNSSGKNLLAALDQTIPPAGSGRVIGEYTGKSLRQISKSICDLVRTKNEVVRQMYSIARDEF